MSTGRLLCKTTCDELQISVPKVAMHLPKMVLKLALVVLLLAIPLGTRAQYSMPGCQGSCGHISLPYPFWCTREGCYHDPEVLITCNESYSQPKAFLTGSNIEVLNISLIEGELEILQSIAYDCYNSTGPSSSNGPSINLSKFRISTKNLFTAIGCDTNAYIRGNQVDKTYGSGCISICDSIDYMTNGSCSGIGCCQTKIPEGVWSYGVALSSYSNHTGVLDFNPCSYAFIVDENKFNFSSKDLSDPQGVSTLPVLLDWAIGYDTCDEARANSSTYVRGIAHVKMPVMVMATAAVA